MLEFWRFKSIVDEQYEMINGEFNIHLVIISVVVSIMAAYSCLIIIERMWSSNSDKTIRLWKLFGSVVFGLGVWAMHFTGMLAYMLPIPMTYSPGVTVLSFFPPMIGAFFSFKILYHKPFTFWYIQLCSLSLALGIGSMHFLGMEAMIVSAEMVYDIRWFIFSILVSHAFAVVSIYLIINQYKSKSDSAVHRLFRSFVMGLSVAGMHYTAMVSVSFYNTPFMEVVHQHHENSFYYIALSVSFFIFLIVAATIFSSIVDSRLQQTELTLAARITREKDIVNNLADGLVIIDDDGVIDSINSMGIEMFGYSEQMLLEHNIKELIPEFDIKSYVKLDQRHNLMLTGVTKERKNLSIEVSVSNMTLTNNEKCFYNCVIRDISKRLELENKLRQAQKLESVGQLAAGIAHEINTPTQYVSDNTIFLKDAFKSYLLTFDRIKEITYLYNDKDYQSRVEKIFEDNDLNFLSEEVPLSIDQSLEGLNRISKIVRAMKSFSHSSDSEKQLVDIAEAIESTVIIARNEWRYIAELRTIFDENVPSIPCFRDEFNQVILNIVINAAHAIEEKFNCLTTNSTPKGLITISTYSEPDSVVIEIEDNGTGIPDEIKNRIFDPFFTTKEVGKGTGQGLSLAYSVIVDLHKGEINTDTILGGGTKFTLKLPISPSLEIESLGVSS